MARMGETPRFGSGRPDRRRQPARLRCRWEDNIKVNLQEIKWRGGCWVGLAQDKDRLRALVIAVLNLWVT